MPKPSPGICFKGSLNIENLDTIRDYSFYNNKALGLLDIKFSDKLKVIGAMHLLMVISMNCIFLKGWSA